MTTTINASTVSGLVQTADTSGVLQLQTANTAAMTIDASQNVGIGTASPSSLLTIQKSQNSDTQLKITNADGGTAALARLDLIDNSSSSLTFVSFSQGYSGTFYGVASAKLKAIFDNSSAGFTNGLMIGTAQAVPLYFATSATERMRIDSAGNVGIGTASPNSYSGYTVLTLNSNTNGTVIDQNVSGVRTGTFVSTSNITTLGCQPASGVLAFQTGGGVERMRISSAGQVLIGATSTSLNSLLNVTASNDAAGISLNNTYATNVWSIRAAIPGVTNSGFAIKDETAAVNRFVIDSAGNVGIGATTVQSRLAVADGGRLLTAGAWSSAVIGLKQTTGNINDLSQLVFGYSSGTQTYGSAYMGFIETNQGTNGYGDLVFGTRSVNTDTQPTERMRIDSSGNLLIGTTSTSQSSNTGVKISPSGTCWLVGSGIDAFSYYNNSAGAYRFYVQQTGQIVATFTTINAVSDQRLKENVKDLDIGLEQIIQLKPRRFDWKEGKGQNKKNAVGFIAQEFETIFPESVGTLNAGEDGVEYKTICHEELIPTLVKAIQEQQAIIGDLKARIELLEKK